VLVEAWLYFLVRALACFSWSLHSFGSFLPMLF